MRERLRQDQDTPKSQDQRPRTQGSPCDPMLSVVPVFLCLHHTTHARLFLDHGSRESNTSQSARDSHEAPLCVYRTMWGGTASWYGRNCAKAGHLEGARNLRSSPWEAGLWGRPPVL